MSNFGLLLEMDIPLNKKYDEMTTEEKNQVDEKLYELYDIVDGYESFSRNIMGKIIKIEKLINHPRYIKREKLYN